jgi:Arc/MetJ-type ribon-helix-helix transcriptional regulator
MDVAFVTLPEEVKAIIERQVATGRVASIDAFLVEAARRLAEDLERESKLVSEGKTSVKDRLVGEYVIIETEADVGRHIGEDETDENEGASFRNFYRCVRCDNAWDDVWSCQCDDDCPACGARHISPYQSEDM